MNDPDLHILDTKQMHNVRSESRDVAQKFPHHKLGKTYPAPIIEQLTWIRDWVKVELDAWFPHRNVNFIPLLQLYTSGLKDTTSVVEKS